MRQKITIKKCPYCEYTVKAYAIEKANKGLNWHIDKKHRQVS